MKMKMKYQAIGLSQSNVACRRNERRKACGESVAESLMAKISKMKKENIRK